MQKIDQCNAGSILGHASATRASFTSREVSRNVYSVVLAQLAVIKGLWHLRVRLERADMGSYAVPVSDAELGSPRGDMRWGNSCVKNLNP